MGGGSGGNKSRNDLGLNSRPYEAASAGVLPTGATSPGTGASYGAYSAAPMNVANTAAGAYGGAVQGGGLGLSALAQNMPGGDLSPYMNPYQQDVINTTMGELDRRKAMTANQIGDAALAAGSFGGGRHGLRESMLDRQYGDIEAQTLAGLNSQNFQNAQNQQQFFANLGGSLTGQLGNLANMGFGFARGINQDQILQGAMQQQMMQNLINAARGQYGGYANAPYRGLQALISSNPGYSGAGTTTQTADQSPVSMVADLLGAASSFYNPGA